jgi:hypothetical protein
MKTYVITLSQRFLSKHSKAGQPTDFAHLFENGQYLKPDGLEVCRHKIHTIRAKYPLWKKRIDEVANGEALLSVRQWTGRPYHSPQVKLADLTAENGVGIQMLKFHSDKDGAILWKYFDVNGKFPNIEDIARHDGLSYEDWKEWFKSYDLSEPLAIIHFTKFRY